MTAHIRNEPALALIYGTRDKYRGVFQATVVQVREPVRVVSMRRSSNIILMAIADGNGVDYWRIATADDPRLQLLGSDDRNQVQALAIAIKQETKNG